MLVLSRKIGEVLNIGPDISLIVLEVSGSRVRLGIAGPRHIPIRRGELMTESDSVSHQTHRVADEAPEAVLVG